MSHRMLTFGAKSGAGLVIPALAPCSSFRERQRHISGQLKMTESRRDGLDSRRVG
jgi:hypothetical protein